VRDFEKNIEITLGCFVDDHLVARVPCWMGYHVVRDCLEIFPDSIVRLEVLEVNVI
jgi:hypothetical protein